MRKTMLTLLALLLSGCVTTQNYAIYAEAQQSISKDQTMSEMTRVQALIEMTKSNDPEVKRNAIIALQQLQQGSKQITIEPPKGPLGF